MGSSRVTDEVDATGFEEEGGNAKSVEDVGRDGLTLGIVEQDARMAERIGLWREGLLSGLSLVKAGSYDWRGLRHNRHNIYYVYQHH